MMNAEEQISHVGNVYFIGTQYSIAMVSDCSFLVEYWKNSRQALPMCLCVFIEKKTTKQRV